MDLMSSCDTHSDSDHLGINSVEKVKPCEEKKGMTSSYIAAVFGDNKQFVSEVEWSARKILRDSNQRRRNEAILLENKAKVRKVKERRCKEPMLAEITAQHVLKHNRKFQRNHPLDQNAARQRILEKQRWILPTVQKSIGRSLPRPPSKNATRAHTVDILPLSKPLESHKLEINAEKVTTEKNMAPSTNILQALQNSPFFTPKMITTTSRPLSANFGGKDPWKRRNKEPMRSTDWTSQVLTIKYRCDDRCQTSNLFGSGEGQGETEDSNACAPNGSGGEATTITSPHPLEEQLRRRILQENDRARAALQQRLLTHNFAFEISKEFQELKDTDNLNKSQNEMQTSSITFETDSFQLPARQIEDAIKPSVEKATDQTIENVSRPGFFTCNDLNIKLNDDTVPSLTIRAADASFVLSKLVCPGCTYFGEKGISWDTLARNPATGDGSFMPMPGMDSTHAAAFFVRTGPESYSPISVTISMAIERPLLACPVLAVESTMMTPEAPRSDHEKPVIPAIMAEYSEILKVPFQSEIDAIIPPSILILNSAADKMDWAGVPAIDNDHTGKEKHRREMNTLTKHGFRCKEMTEPRRVDGTIKTHVFGISEQALTPNMTFVSPPILLHTKEFITAENLTRKRTYADYRYVLQDPFGNKAGGSPPDTSIFIIHLNAYSVRHIERLYLGTLSHRKEEKRRKEEEDVQKASLEAKITAGISLFEKKRLQEKQQIEVELNGCAIVKSVETESLCNHQRQICDPLECKEEKITQKGDIHADLPCNACGSGWRQLPSATIGADFLNENVHKVERYSGNFLNQYTKTRIIGLVDPAKHISYVLDDLQFQRTFDTLFIADVQEDLNQFLAETEAHERRSRGQNAKADDVGTSKDKDFFFSFDGAMQQVKSSSPDYEALEQILVAKDDHRAFDINTRDKFGNTLLLLACQQGTSNKRICKLFLRRGADINAQNHMGNTCLHYLMAYNQSPVLAQYMIQRGADDSLLNVDGMTCYEGLNKKNSEEGGTTLE